MDLEYDEECDEEEPSYEDDEPSLAFSPNPEFYDSRLPDNWEAKVIHRQKEDQSGQVFYLVEFTRSDYFHWVEEEEIEYVNGGPEALLKYEAKVAEKQRLARQKQPSSRYSPSNQRCGGSYKNAVVGSSKPKKKKPSSTQGWSSRYIPFKDPIAPTVYPPIQPITYHPPPQTYYPYRFSDPAKDQDFPAPYVQTVFISNLYLNSDVPPLIKPVIIEKEEDRPTMRELASAIQGGDPEKVKDMIVRGAKVNHLFGFLGESGRLPLGWAAYVGHVKIMEMLIRAGADIEARDGSSVGVFDCARTKPVKRFLLLLTAPPKFYRSFMAVYALGLQSNLDATREILQKFVICYFASEKPRMVTRGNDVLVFANDEWREARYNPKPQDLSVPWWMRQ